MIDETAAMIDEYVQRDPTKFCTYEEFQKGVTAIRSFCTLRAESVSGQLDGTIPSTSDGQKQDSSALIDAGDLTISDMGSMSMGGGKGGNMFGKRSRSGDAGNTGSEKQTAKASETAVSSLSFNSLSNLTVQPAAERPDRGRRPDFGGQSPEGFDPGNMPEGFDPGNMPEGFDPGNMPDGFDPGNMPEGFDPGNMPEGFDPGNMPDGFEFGNQPSQAESGEGAEQSDADEKQAGSSADKRPENDGQKDADASGGQFTKPSDSADRSDNSRPQFSGGFPGMDGGTPQNSAAAWILLGVSALVLLIGLGFAAKFKR